MVQTITPRGRKQDLLYSDLRKDMLANLVNADVSRYTDEEAVKESIKNLVLTDVGERLFQPNIGCDVRRLLFENFTPQTKNSIEVQVKSTIEQYETRCNLISVIATSSPDEYSVLITVVFNVINKIDNVVLELVLERAR